MRVTEQLKASHRLSGDVILGWVSLFVIIAAAIIGFYLNHDRGNAYDTLIADPSQVSRVSVDALKKMMDSDSRVLVVDTRSIEAYEIEHIAGSVSIPVQEISQHYTELRLYQQVVTYCT